MPAKRKKPAAKKKRPAVKMDPNESYLLVLIAASERAITSQGTYVDQFFVDQTKRLKDKLEKLRASR